MSDQADNLRQLVRAQRQWRELALQEQSATVSRPRFPDAFPLEQDKVTEGRPRTRGKGIGVFVARAARWAFGRATARAG